MTGHKLKYVRFYGREVPVVLQNENGPCPLLAIANVLLLRDAIHLPPNTFEVEQEKLMAILAEYLLDNNPVEPSSHFAANLQQNLQDVIANMHKLTTGVDVNPKFSSVRGFEFTNETAIFDLFDISLVHGWIMDPEEEVAASVGGMSYNQVVAKLISTLGTAALQPTEEPPLIDLDAPSAESVHCQFEIGEGGVHVSLNVVSPMPLPEGPSHEGREVDSMELRKWEAVRDWLQHHPSQLSMFGLFQLHQQLPEKDLAVFFRNNHFTTIFKEKKALYILVTDQGYLSESTLVWEKLESVSNDNQFCTGDFQPFEGPSQRFQSESQHDRDYALAMSLSTQPQGSATAGLLPNDFLTLSPPSAPGYQNHDADLALALQLQEEENQVQERVPARSGGYSDYARPPWRSDRASVQGYSAGGRPGEAPRRQFSFPAGSGYGAGGRCQPPPQESRVPVSQAVEAPAPDSIWKRFRRMMKFDR